VNERRLALVRTGLSKALWFAAVVVGAVVFLQALLQLAPGDPIDLLPDPEAVREQLTAEWQLDRPFHERIIDFVGGALRGDLGESLTVRPGESVSRLLARPALRSLGLCLAAMACAVAWGTGLGAWTAGRGVVVRWLVPLLSLAPVFLLAHLSMEGLNAGAAALIDAGTITRPGWFALPIGDHPLKTSLAVVVLAVGSGSLAEIWSEVEAAVVRVNNSGYLDAARSRGQRTAGIVARNLAAPIAGIVATRAPWFVGELVVIDKMLQLNGAGSLLWRAAEQRDYPVAIAVALLAALFVATTHLFADAVRIVAEPRSRAA
jgi:peptide/nickel transport system permease protein